MFDFIVVRAGFAGCPIAKRIAKVINRKDFNRTLSDKYISKHI